MTHLRDLDPRWSKGVAAHELSFTCPKCGPPYRVTIHVHHAPPVDGVWTWDYVGLPHTPWDQPGGLRVTPSIDNRNHGRKRGCSFHGTIIASEIVPS